MKINDRKELHGKTVEELEKIVKESYNTLSQIRLDNVQNKLKNTRSMTHTRKEIAVIKTIINEKVKVAGITKTEEPTKEKEVKAASSK